MMTVKLKSHFSELSLFRKCPQAWNYRYVQGIRDIQDDVAPPLEFGSWWNVVRAAENLERGRWKGSLEFVPESLGTVDGGPKLESRDLTVDDVFQAAEGWWSKRPAADREEVENWLGQPLPLRLREAYRRWKDQWGEDLENESPLAVEMYWEREVRRSSSGTSWSLYGFVDEIYRDEKKGLIVVRDYKTGRSLAKTTALDDFMDSQLHLYAWGVSPKVKEWTGESVGATAFDRIRSVAPKTPKLNLSGTLSKSVTDFDLTTYLEWAKGEDGKGIPYPGRKKDGSGAGLYTAEESEIARLSSKEVVSGWFQRTLTPVSLNVIRGHLRAALDSIEDMERSRVRLEEEGELARNMTSANCRWCPFVNLCYAQMVGGPDGEYLLEDYGLRKV